MKRFFVSLLFSLFALPISAGINARVSRVVDSRTIVLDNGTSVTLRGVDVPADEESAAAEYLRTLVGNAPVYVENGDVYRSPEVLLVNEQMAQHPWRHHERYLGIAQPSGRTVAMPAPAPSPQQRVAPPRHPRRNPRARARK